MKLQYNRGDIYNCTLPEFTNLAPYQQNSVQKGYRPVVIVTSLTGLLSNNDTINVCPLTTKIKDFSTNVNISWSKDNRPNQILCNQIMTIPRAALYDKIGSLTESEIIDVTEVICATLGITQAMRADVQKSTIALNEAKADRHQLENILLPQAKTIIQELQQLINRVNNTKIKVTKKGRIKRTDADLEAFANEWDDPHNNHNEVAEAFGFNSYSTAYSAYQRYKRRSNNGTV